MGVRLHSKLFQSMLLASAALGLLSTGSPSFAQEEAPAAGGEKSARERDLQLFPEQQQYGRHSCLLDRESQRPQKFEIQNNKWIRFAKFYAELDNVFDKKYAASGNVVADSTADANKTLFFAGYGRAFYAGVTLGLF